MSEQEKQNIVNDDLDDDLDDDLSEQERVLKNDKKFALVSASAGSGKTYTMLKYICRLVCQENLPIEKILVLTFTKAAAAQMKTRLLDELKKNESKKSDEFIAEQIDALSTANISTIHSFCEKNLKKYANLLDLSENFQLMEENDAKNLKLAAFERAFKIFEEQFPENFANVYESYKNDKKKICEIVFEIEKLAGAVADEDKLFEIDLEKSFDDALALLHQILLDKIVLFFSQLETLHLPDFEQHSKQSLSGIFSCKNFLEICQFLSTYHFPTKPGKDKIGDEASAAIDAIRLPLKNFVDEIKALNLMDPENFSQQKSGILEKNVINLYKIYEKEQKNLKKTQNLLDFNDLEKYMNVLSTHENLFDGFEYVFVDEYQDTNKIQEKIIKNVAKNCKFVAVGDVKQGIYGFRLASSEIFLKDLSDFDARGDGEVYFLKTNFRSSQKVLDFVNEIFSICMTEQQSGVDYARTAMLKQYEKNVFAEENYPAVTIDLVKPCPQQQDEAPEFYSVKNANINRDTSNQNLLLAVKMRILDALSSKISDKNGNLRKVNFSDIAIISRERTPFFKQLEEYLVQSGIPVFANSKSNLLDEPEILVLMNYLKIVLCENDEIALASVLMSGLYRFDADTLLQAKYSVENENAENLWEIVKKNQIFANFLQDLQEFRQNYVVFGIRQAFEILFEKTDYFSYINLQPNRLRLNLFVSKFLAEVEKNNFDLPALLHLLQNVPIAVVSENTGGEDAVLLTTIHDSKGLEWPIVFLLGCENSLSGGQHNANIEIDEKFGLALKIYSAQANAEYATAKMLAICENRRAKQKVEELMIFYVALTRAQNRLSLFGSYDDKKPLQKATLQDCNSYFDYIFFSHPQAAQQLQESGTYKTQTTQMQILDEVTQDEIAPVQNLQQMPPTPEIVEKIQKYINFSYKFEENLNFRLKESVTALCNKFDDQPEKPLHTRSTESFSFGGNFVETGIAYHAALKAIDFDKVQNLETLRAQMQQNSKFFDITLVDEQILLKNILLLKNLLQDAKIFKEQEFMLKESVSNLLESSVDEKILVQGVVDLYAEKQGEIVLIDYKYSNIRDEQILKEKYKNQLKLYKIALENAKKVKINEIYLLSLKNCKLIKCDL